MLLTRLEVINVLVFNTRVGDVSLFCGFGCLGILYAKPAAAR